MKIKSANVLITGGVIYKLSGAVKNNADIMLVPEDNYEEAYIYKKEHNFDIELVSISTDGYISNAALGFEVTTNNKIYDLSDEEFGVLAAVVSCEAKKTSRDDVLAVMSVILNRADSSRYPNDPVAVVAAPYQFSCYKGNTIVPNDIIMVESKERLTAKEIVQ